MTARCPTCKRFVHRGARCHATNECRLAAAKVDAAMRERGRLPLAHAAAGSFLRARTPSEREAIREWMDLYLTLESDEREQARAALEAS